VEYLGIQVRRDHTAKTIILSQDKYITNLLVKFNMTNCKPVSTPLEASICFFDIQDENLTPEELSLMASILYAQAIGYLQWLVTCYRFDLAFPVNHLAQFIANLGPHY